MEWVETTGRTVEVALDAALDELGVDENDVEYEGLARPRGGLLGRFGGAGRVRGPGGSPSRGRGGGKPAAGRGGGPRRQIEAMTGARGSGLPAERRATARIRARRPDPRGTGAGAGAVGAEGAANARPRTRSSEQRCTSNPRSRSRSQPLHPPL